MLPPISLKLPMMLLAESGATKTEWQLGSPGNLIKAWRGEGLNPNALNEETLRIRLDQQLQSIPNLDEVSHVQFYGAGLGRPGRVEQMKHYLLGYFPSATLSIQDDLKASLDCQGVDTGIVMIVGTGSNVARFEEGQRVAQAGGLGYLLGDEGSGVDLGRSLLRALLMPGWPQDLKEYFFRAIGLPPQTIISALYDSQPPTAFLSRLAPLLSAAIDHPKVQALVQQRFSALVESALLPLLTTKTLPILATGSVAYHFEGQLRSVLTAQDLNLAGVIPDPVQALGQRFFGLLE